MSPSARGLVPGLLLALAAAFGVLAANDHWLFPALDETGVRYLVSSPDLAAGRRPSVAIAEWDADAAVSGLEGQGKLTPLLMAAGIRGGARAHVAALWVTAASAALALLAIAWGAGGVAGVAGAFVAGALALASPLALEATTALGPDPTLAALVLILLGAMAYQPRWYVVHGLVAALAWLAAPAGIGAVAAVVLWPLVRGAAGTERRVGTLLAVAPSAALVLAAFRWPVLTPPGWTWTGAGVERALTGLAASAAPGLTGPAAWGVGLVVLVSLAALVASEARTSPKPEGPVAWSDPAAPDHLATTFRPAAMALVVGTALGAAGVARGGELGRPWLATALLLTTWAAVAAVRRARQRRGGAAWWPLIALGLWGGAAAWDAVGTLRDGRASGRGMTTKAWVASPVVRWLDNESGVWDVVYADQPALVLLHAGLPARRLSPGTDLSRFAAAFAEHPGVVVVTGPAGPWADTLQAVLNLKTAVESPEGRVLLPGAPPTTD